jgi:DNA-binding phage protein
VVKASPGFPAVAKATGIHEKSLIRMLGPKGNPTAASLARIFRVLADHHNVDFVVKTSPRKKTKAVPKAA